MTKKIFLGLFIITALVFSCTFVFAENTAENAADGVRNVVGGAENAMEDARFGEPFPSEDIVRIIEDGETKYWNVCKAFETDDADLTKSFQVLFDDHPTEKGGEG